MRLECRRLGSAHDRAHIAPQRPAGVAIDRPRAGGFETLSRIITPALR
jgi:hypothetical protein